MRDDVLSRIIFVREIMFGDMFSTLSKSLVSDSEDVISRLLGSGLLI